MTSTTRSNGAMTIVDVTGHIDMGNSPALRKTLLDCLKEGKSLAVNLGGVKYIDSSGIASLLEILKAARCFRRCSAQSYPSKRDSKIFVSLITYPHSEAKRFENSVRRLPLEGFVNFFLQRVAICDGAVCARDFLR